MCKIANLTVFPIQNHTPPHFFKLKVDSQAEGNSLKKFCFNLLMCVFGRGGLKKAIIKNIINLA